MKTIYNRMLAVVLTCLCAAGFAFAQPQWKVNKPQQAPSQPPVSRADATDGQIYLGYCNYYDYIYPWDGLSQSTDCRVGVAIKLTRDKFKNYIGGKVSALRLGWDEQSVDGSFDVFVRTSFDGENLATGKGTGKFGWKIVSLDEPFEIPDVEELVVGYYTDLTAQLCCIPKFYPQNVPNSCYLFADGDVDAQGNEIWYDFSSIGVMAIMLVIDDAEGKFVNMAEIQDLRYEHIGQKGDAKAAVFTVRNMGSNALGSIEITTEVGGQSVSEEVKLSSPLSNVDSKSVNLPITYLGSGKGQVKVTKINGAECADPFTTDSNLIAVPQDVAEQYVFRPLIEFFGSENNYMVPSYFDEYFMSDFYEYRDRITLVNQHVDDQFMTGKNDALYMMLSLCGGDSLKVFLPNMCMDRTDYLSNLAPIPGTPFLYGIPYPGEGSNMYRYILERPTFASVSVTPTVDDEGQNMTVEVKGDVAQGVMPEGEPLYLTVYVMESEVESNSQKSWHAKEGEQPSQHYTHYNAIRDTPTPLWGKQLELADDGSYSTTFEAPIYSEYNPAKLSVVAFLNRGVKNDHLSREVINSTEAAVPLPAGIGTVEMTRGLEVRQGVLYLDGAPAEVYNLAGVRVQSVKGTHGVYVVKSAVNRSAKAMKIAF